MVSIDAWKERPVPALIDHILQRYHEPLKRELPRLSALAERVAALHPEHGRVAEVFEALRWELDAHLAKEEQVLFPMILAGQGEMAGPPIAVMEREHDAATRALAELRSLTGDYAAPDGAAPEVAELWAGLQALEGELRAHIALENDVLHPRALGAGGVRP